MRIPAAILLGCATVLAWAGPLAASGPGETTTRSGAAAAVARGTALGSATPPGPSERDFRIWNRRRALRAARAGISGGLRRAADRTTGWWSELPPAAPYSEILDGNSDPAGSLAIGSTGNGELQGAVRLPFEGDNYSVIDRHRGRGTHWGTSELVSVIRHAADSVADTHPGSSLRVGNLGYEDGGPIPWSVSHTNGRDADLAFYCERASTGEPVEAPGMLAFDAEGRAVEDRSLAFDVVRNWRLVAALLRAPQTDMQWLFISRPLKRKLLEHARHRGAPRYLIRRARKVLHQPTGSSPHNDHLHVRITCSRADRLRGCLNYGPRWDWVDWHRDDLLARSLELGRAIQRGERSTQIAALDYLHRIRSPYAPEVALTLGMDAEANDVRSRALDVATDVKWWSASAVAETIELIRNPEHPLELKRRAYEILRRDHSDRARRFALSRLLDDSVSTDEQVHAARALGHVLEPGLVPVLLDVLEKRSGDVRAETARVLRRITGHRVVSAWSGLSGPEARRAVRDWRSWWNRHRSESRADWLRDAFRAHGFRAEKVFTDRAIGELIELLRETPEHVSYAANRALHSITGRWVPFEGWSDARLHEHWSDWWEVERHERLAAE